MRILYKCEAGSRAWGYAQPTSDSDVRFIFVRPLDDYLSLSAAATTEMYGCGWDLKKALGLFLKSNVSLLECLRSPIIYIDEGLREQLLTLVDDYYSPRAVGFSYLRNTGAPTSGKEYLQVLRPLLSCNWVCTTGELPPVDIRDLLKCDVDTCIKDTVMSLLANRDAKLHIGINSSIAFLHRKLKEICIDLPVVYGPVGPLNELFRSWL